MTTAMTLKKRIILGYLLPLTLFAIVSVAIFLQARALQATTDLVRDAQQVTILAQEMQARFQEEGSATRGFILAPEPTIRSAVESARSEFLESRQALEALVNDGEQKQSLRRIDAAYKPLLEHNERLLAQATARDRRDAIDTLGTQRASQLNVALEQALSLFIADERKILGQRVERQTDELQRMVFLVGGATTMAIIISLVVGNLVASRITRNVGDMISSMSASTAEIAAMVDEHERTATQQAAAVNETTTTVDELGASSRQSADQAESTAAIAQQTLDAANDGGRLAAQVSQSMTDLQHKVGSVADQISRLSEQASQIGGIARVVGELANETNMLALNAAVEAARAGEQGKGFAVVASEVRKLAEQSKKSAERVHLVVAEIQKATNSAVMVAEDGTRTASDAVAITQHTLQAFEGIANAARNVSVSTQQVVLNSKQQSIALNQVTEAMKSLTAGAVQIATATQQTRQGVQNLDQVARDLKAVI